MHRLCITFARACSPVRRHLRPDTPVLPLNEVSTDLHVNRDCVSSKAADSAVAYVTKFVLLFQRQIARVDAEKTELPSVLLTAPEVFFSATHVVPYESDCDLSLSR